MVFVITPVNKLQSNQEAIPVAKKFLVWLFTLMLILSATGLASAFTFINDGSNPSGEWDLYTIFNDIYGTSYSSSDALFVDRGLADSADDWWYETNGHIELTVRYAGYDQELGIIDNDGYMVLATGIQPGRHSNPSATLFNASGNFVFVETLSGSGSGVGPWYSDDRNSSTVDHFLAFDVSDLETSSTGRAWLIAFEDLADGGDWDYNDLVAVVTDVAPVPAPTSILLLGSGLMGLAGLRRNFRKE
jgi:hypothetical protein